MKRKNRNTQLQRSLLATALLGCMALTNAAYAQSASSTVRGTVAGSEAGTVVTATNTADGSVRRTTTGANGSYTLLGLAPGTYRVEAGPGTAQTVRVTVASSATLNLAAGGDAPAAGGAVTDLATVSVTAPALEEVNTSEVGQNISLRQIQTVPQASRNFS